MHNLKVEVLTSIFYSTLLFLFFSFFFQKANKELSRNTCNIKEFLGGSIYFYLLINNVPFQTKTTNNASLCITAEIGLVERWCKLWLMMCQFQDTKLRTPLVFASGKQKLALRILTYSNLMIHNTNLLQNFILVLNRLVINYCNHERYGYSAKEEVVAQTYYSDQEN